MYRVGLKIMLMKMYALKISCLKIKVLNTVYVFGRTKRRVSRVPINGHLVRHI
jgi:hypothetical protein